MQPFEELMNTYNQGKRDVSFLLALFTTEPQ